MNITSPAAGLQSAASETVRVPSGSLQAPGLVMTVVEAGLAVVPSSHKQRVWTDCTGPV